MINTSSADAGQLPLVTVQRSVALVPSGTPVTTEVGDAGDATTAVPFTTLQMPEPVNAGVADSVKEEPLQIV